MTELLVVLRGLGVRAVQPICRQTPSAKVVLSREGGSLTAAVVRASQVTGARARELIGSPCDGPVVVVADRITDDARSLLSAAGWSWLDLRGHLHLRLKAGHSATSVATTLATSSNFVILTGGLHPV